MENSKSRKPLFEQRLQSAIIGITDEFLTLEEAVDKYDVAPGKIIRELRKIQKSRKAALKAQKVKEQIAKRERRNQSKYL